jgi:folate-binding protein YgfZ
MTHTDTDKSARQDWLNFLQSQGAQIDNGLVTGFSDTKIVHTPSPETTLLCELSNKGIIKACGEEAQAFLQNQFCNDVHTVTASASELNGYCTPKGRLLAFFRLWQQDDCYYLSLPRERLAATLKRLQMFVLMSKVNLSDVSDELISIGLSGADSLALLNEYAGSDAVPAQVDECRHHKGLTLIRLPGSHPRFEITGTREAVQSLWQHLSTRAQPATEEAWQWQDIQAGIPQIVDATAEAFVPQMVNLEHIGALSFKKGCYPGQEIVARTHYLGKQKRRMYLAHVENDTPPAAGDAIVAAGDSSGQSVGTVVSAAHAPGGGADLLAVLQIAQAQQGELVLAAAQNPPLIFKDLPYSVEEEESGK